MVKKLGIAVVVLVILIAGGLYFLLSNLDSLVRTVVEEAGTEATGVKVSLGEVNLDLTGGKAAMGDLNVANPSGFDTDYAFNLGNISVSLDLDSLQSNPIVVKEVVVTAPKVIYELGDGGSNIDKIQSNVENFTKQLGGGGSSESSSEGEEVKVVINDLYIRGAEVSVSAPFLQGEALGTELPEIHLEDIGKESGGASPGEVASQVIDQLTAGVQGAVGALNLDGLKDAAGAAVEGAAKAAEGAAEEAGKAVEGIGEGAGSAVEDATKGVKSLFGSD